MNKKKIFNDPVYGFISIPFDIIYDLIEHPYFQRLRNIKQLGLTHLVYPGALHTRFHHALGAMHLMGAAIENIRHKGTQISEAEAEAATIAILLHDIGHGPYSHALEHCLIPEVQHEAISLAMMKRINKDMNGRLDLAIKIFTNQYKRKFFHALVSSQLDMDRLDYLNRDSFYTGVSEGVIGFDRILKMICVVNDNLVIEEKGIYSIEKFLTARRLMYWQVYFHKTVIAAEQMLIKILERAKEVATEGTDLFCTPALHTFLYKNIKADDFFGKENYINDFSALDDSDIHSAIKVWQTCNDEILSTLCQKLVSRKLYKIKLQNKAFTSKEKEEIKENTMRFGQSNKTLKYSIFADEIVNSTYDLSQGSINILKKDGSVNDFINETDNPTIEAITKKVKKYFVCHI